MDTMRAREAKRSEYFNTFDYINSKSKREIKRYFSEAVTNDYIVIYASARVSDHLSYIDTLGCLYIKFSKVHTPHACVWIQLNTLVLCKYIESMIHVLQGTSEHVAHSCMRII